MAAISTSSTTVKALLGAFTQCSRRTAIRSFFGCVQPGTLGGSAESKSKAHDDDICVMNADGSNVIDITNTAGVFENAPHWYALP
jgi:hypothetical protein